MTTNKRRKRPSKGKYDVNYDPRPPKLINIGVSLVSLETYTIIQDDRAVELHCEDDITYLTVDRNLIEIPNSSSIKYDVIADILDTQGFPKRLWKIMSVWGCVEDNIANNIF